ncbi:MAG: muconolactone Delta-isomerase family protein [Candidatus Limnocylindrales bacterium]
MDGEHAAAGGAGGVPGPHRGPAGRPTATLTSSPGWWRPSGCAATELAAAGTIRRLWRLPGRRANWGIWEAQDATALHAAISSLPFFPYLDVEVIPLAAHPGRPGATRRASSPLRPRPELKLSLDDPQAVTLTPPEVATYALT